MQRDTELEEIKHSLKNLRADIEAELSRKPNSRSGSMSSNSSSPNSPVMGRGSRAGSLSRSSTSSESTSLSSSSGRGRAGSGLNRMLLERIDSKIKEKSEKKIKEIEIKRNDLLERCNHLIGKLGTLCNISNEHIPRVFRQNCDDQLNELLALIRDLTKINMERNENLEKYAAPFIDRINKIIDANQKSIELTVAENIDHSSAREALKAGGNELDKLKPAIKHMKNVKQYSIQQTYEWMQTIQTTHAGFSIKKDITEMLKTYLSKCDDGNYDYPKKFIQEELDTMIKYYKRNEDVPSINLTLNTLMINRKNSDFSKRVEEFIVSEVNKIIHSNYSINDKEVALSNMQNEINRRPLKVSDKVKNHIQVEMDHLHLVPKKSVHSTGLFSHREGVIQPEKISKPLPQPPRK